MIEKTLTVNQKEPIPIGKKFYLPISEHFMVGNKMIDATTGSSLVLPGGVRMLDVNFILQDRGH